MCPSRSSGSMFEDPRLLRSHLDNVFFQDRWQELQIRSPRLTFMGNPGTKRGLHWILLLPDRFVNPCKMGGEVAFEGIHNLGFHCSPVRCPDPQKFRRYFLGTMNGARSEDRSLESLEQPKPCRSQFPTLRRNTNVQSIHDRVQSNL